MAIMVIMAPVHGNHFMNDLQAYSSTFLMGTWPIIRSFSSALWYLLLYIDQILLRLRPMGIICLFARFTTFSQCSCAPVLFLLAIIPCSLLLSTVSLFCAALSY
jgi:hypothetical protein